MPSAARRVARLGVRWRRPKGARSAAPRRALATGGRRELSDARGQRFAREAKRPLPRELGICCCERSASDKRHGRSERPC